MVNEGVARAKLATPSGQQLSQADALVIGTIHKPQPICKLGDRFDRLVALGARAKWPGVRSARHLLQCSFRSTANSPISQAPDCARAQTKDFQFEIPHQ